MTTTSQGRRPSAEDLERKVSRAGQDARARRSSALRAGLVGAFSLLVILLINQIAIPFPVGTCLVTLGLVVVWLGTGILAGLLADEAIQTRRQAVASGTLAGFVAGLGGGIAAMAIAAFGALFPELGQGVLSQFAPAQLEALAKSGVTPEVIQAAGSILAALMACGVVGMLPALALGALGGRIYFRLRQA